MLQSPIGRVASQPMRNIETFPSKHMYLYLSLVERKVAEFYHNMFKMTYFHRFLQTIEGVLDNLLLLIFLLDNTKENTSSVTYKMFCVFLRGGRGVSARDRIGDGDLKVTRCTSFQTHTVQSHAIPPSPPCSTFTQLSKLPNFPLTSSGTVLFRLHGEKLKN